MHDGEADDPATRAPRYQPSAYGDRLAAQYDALYPAAELETDAAVDFIAELAQHRETKSFLEFGIGTGRLALGVQLRGVHVAGIESSEQMIAALRAKAPPVDIEVALGDYVNTSLGRTFSVVAIVLNNVFDPRGMQAQIDLFANAARHLDTDGCFVVEAFVLDSATRDGSWSMSPRYVGEDHLEIQLMRFDIDTNSLERTLLHLRPEGPTFITVRDTYASPHELDLIAHVTGFERVGRYSNWIRGPFTAVSQRHVSVYQRR